MTIRQWLDEFADGVLGCMALVGVALALIINRLRGRE